MNLEYSARVRIGITFVAVYALVSSSLLLLNKDVDTTNIGYWYYKSIDGVTLHENRFKGLINLLQAYTVAGYITDLPPDKAIEGHYLTQYHLAQYALSPAIVADGTAHPFVIGNFHKPVDISRISQDSHLTLITDSGNGVMLFRNEKVK